MRLEAITNPIRYRFKDGREVLLMPGVPVDLPEASARSLLTQAVGKVQRVAEASVSLLAIRPPVAPSTDEAAPASVCPTCRQERFWCATCPPCGQWVCRCSHPQQAMEVMTVVRRSSWQPGQVVVWESPRCGRLTGVYVGAVGRYQIKVRHPLTLQDAVIPLAWVTTEGEN